MIRVSPGGHVVGRTPPLATRDARGENKDSRASRRRCDVRRRAGRRIGGREDGIERQAVRSRPHRFCEDIRELEGGHNVRRRVDAARHAVTEFVRVAQNVLGELKMRRVVGEVNGSFAVPPSNPPPKAYGSHSG